MGGLASCARARGFYKGVASLGFFEWVKNQILNLGGLFFYNGVANLCFCYIELDLNFKILVWLRFCAG